MLLSYSSLTNHITLLAGSMVIPRSPRLRPEEDIVHPHTISPGHFVPSRLSNGLQLGEDVDLASLVRDDSKYLGVAEHPRGGISS
jgi:hypothetical protein